MKIMKYSIRTLKLWQNASTRQAIEDIENNLFRLFMNLVSLKAYVLKMHKKVANPDKSVDQSNVRTTSEKN